ncbi:MAG: tRNA (adenosine(37)-N6)-threonylcarbamoyltransferase complex dimerization subunit type 1 TsaB [Hyphomicrobiales bacterium]
MNILALDTSMGACSAAVSRVADGMRTLHARYAEMPRGHAEALMPMVHEVLSESGLDPRDIDVLAATQGPGSFTGVRIAIAAARGLALVTKAKLYGTDSLTVMARAAVDGLEPQGPFAVAVDARRGMLYFGLYNATGCKLDGPRLVGPDDAASLLPDDCELTVGSGGSLLADAATRPGSIVSALPDLQPNAAVLAQLALDAGETSAMLRPLYLRPPDAKPQTQILERR